MKRTLMAMVLGSSLALVGCGGPKEAAVEEAQQSMDATMSADTMTDTMGTGTTSPDDAAADTTAPATTE